MFHEVSVRCTHDLVDIVEESLEQTNAIAITLRNGDEREYEPTTDGDWSVTQVIALLPLRTDLLALETALINLGCDGFCTRAINESEWRVKLSQPRSDLVVGPFVIGDVSPRYMTPQIPLEIPAGLAFGTGAHETTSLCLEWLSRQPLSGKHVLDLGCGSGILAIAAMKLGASSATAIDNDETALTIANENAMRNEVKISVSNRLHLENRFDLAIANIYADTLNEYAEQLEHVLNPTGSLALSGILMSQSEQIERAYANCRFNPVESRNDWVLLTGLKQH